MAKTKEIRLSSFSEYINEIEKLQHNAKSPLWYRGAGDIKHQLVPTIYRHPKKLNQNEFKKLESDLLLRFRQRSIPFHSRDIKEDWDAIFFMQHYGVPTRLLDWSENPFVALHFALMSAPRQKNKSGKHIYVKPVAVWVLNPTVWNAAALKHISFESGILTPGDDSLKGYAPSAAVTSATTSPVALFGAHNSSRIVAQQGVFTIFGSNNSPMETLAKTLNFPESALIRFIIPANKITALRRSLLNHGITESTIFPDLEGLARETKRHFGFED
jgi:FRG domain